MKHDPLNQQIEVFLESLASEKGYSVNTGRAYRQDLEEFSSYLEKKKTGGL